MPVRSLHDTISEIFFLRLLTFVDRIVDLDRKASGSNLVKTLRYDYNYQASKLPYICSCLKFTYLIIVRPSMYFSSMLNRISFLILRNYVMFHREGNIESSRCLKRCEAVLTSTNDARFPTTSDDSTEVVLLSNPFSDS